MLRMHGRTRGVTPHNMKFLLITKDPEVVEAAEKGFHPSDETLVFDSWRQALEAAEGADLIFVDLIATLDEPHKIGGYEAFAHAKMDHPVAKGIPLVLISPPETYELDFMAGWPDFVFGHVRRPVDYRIFRRASTWI
jgi:CheY-like chemotaxis protein